MKPQIRPRSVLLAHSYFLRYDEKQWHRMKPYPPLATLLAAASLRHAGYTVYLFDAMLASGVDDFREVVEDLRPPLVAIVEDNFNFLTKMCTVRMRQAALDMITAAKAVGCHVAVNGSDATDYVGTYLGAGADAVLIGEPELTLVELMNTWSEDLDGSVSHVPGIVTAASGDSGEIPTVPAPNLRPCIKDLDKLPFPAWDLIDEARYREAWVGAHGRLSWNMVASRGCPYKCNWCAKPLFGTRYTQRSPTDVVKELLYLRERVKPDHIWFADDIFGITPDWIEEFADEVVAGGIRIPFTIQSRVNLMRPDTVAALARAGAEEVWLGVESGSQAVLDAMDKGSTVDQVRQATRELKANGVRAGWFIQLGYLGETWSDILATRDLVRAEQPDDIGVSVSYPLPGTKFFEMVKEQLGPKRNWDDSDDLAMMFSGTYDTDFYRRVRTLLHEEVDARGDMSARFAEGLERRWSELERAANFDVDKPA